MDNKRERLIDLYRRMAEHTAQECAAPSEFGCKRAFACCHPAICFTVIAWAKEKWGVELAPTGHERLPLMGPDGCIAAPHLRPTCSVHACCMVEYGEKPGDPDWTRAYAELLAEIKEIEDPKDQLMR
ncbi:hypothetical protein MTBLM1_90118 [Rhodospirillaceae bacterium LM-1]|nr:hypothetical protein MTBLM1_90118 [Rhodospirillaceae bacterium LM-1]